MGTQKTGKGGTNEPPNEELDANTPVETAVEDLGIPENVEFAEDPTGYVPDTSVKTVGGRKVRPIEDRHLAEAHQRYAGDVPMHGAPSIGQAQQTPSDASYEDKRPPEQKPPTASPGAQQVADQMLSGFQQQQPSAPQQQPPARNSNVQAAAAAGEDSYERAQQVEETAAAFEYLKRQESASRAKGDLDTAAQAKAMASRLADDFNIEEVRIKKERHPAMQRLLANLGLERIKPAEIEWCGSMWRFAPSSAPLDYWQHKNMTDDGLNVAALMISASLVGLDGEPLYKVLNIPLVGRYKITGSGPDMEDVPVKYVTINIYPKQCDCGNEIGTDADKCDVCGAVHDPFEMPHKLRQICAEKFFRLLEEKFGAYEELAELLDLRAKKMKDRRFDKEDVFPLLKSSRKASTTAA